MMSKIFVVIAFLAVAHGLQVRQCKKGPLPLKLVVKNCEGDIERCPLYRGESGIADITFQVPSDQEEIFIKVVAHVAGLPVPYPMPEPNACKSLTQGLCPIDEGEEVTYQMKVPVEKIYPKISLDLEVSILDENKVEALTCFIIPAKVVDKNFLIYNKQ